MDQSSSAGDHILKRHPRHTEKAGKCTERIHVTSEACPKCGVQYMVSVLVERGTRRETASVAKAVFKKTQLPGDADDISHCYLCWNQIRLKERNCGTSGSWAIEHYLPHSKYYAQDDETNMLPACQGCNSAKSKLLDTVIHFLTFCRYS